MLTRTAQWEKDFIDQWERDMAPVMERYLALVLDIEQLEREEKRRWSPNMRAELTKGGK